MDRLPPAPCMFVEPPFAAPGTAGDPPLGLRHRRLITLMCSAWLPRATPVWGVKNHRRPSTGLTARRRAKPLRSIGLPCSSCCVAASPCGGGRHQKGLQHFLRHVACLEGRVLAGSQIRTAILSQWVPRRHCRVRQRKTALFHAAGHSRAQWTNAQDRYGGSLENGSMSGEVPAGAAELKECAERDERR
jgi:hypothetical protein